MKVVQFHLLVRDIDRTEPLTRIGFRDWGEIAAVLRAKQKMQDHLMYQVARGFREMLDHTVQAAQKPDALDAISVTTIHGYSVQLRAEGEEHRKQRNKDNNALEFTVEFGKQPHSSVMVFMQSLAVNLALVRPRLRIKIDEYTVPAYALASSVTYALGGDAAYAQEILSRTVERDDGPVELA